MCQPPWAFWWPSTGPFSRSLQLLLLHMLLRREFESEHSLLKSFNSVCIWNTVLWSNTCKSSHLNLTSHCRAFRYFSLDFHITNKHAFYGTSYCIPLLPWDFHFSPTLSLFLFLIPSFFLHPIFLYFLLFKNSRYLFLILLVKALSNSQGRTFAAHPKEKAT